LVEIEVGKARIGEAYIYSTICGETPKQYKVSIIKTDYINKVKNFVVKIDDENLLEDAGGIVQGMSGSPIVQNGKLVGAITHVFINDPTRGFGIAIENMINN
jgi:stage IV sporulation protein B